MSMRVLLKTLNHLTIFKLLNSILLFKLLQYLQFSVLLWCIECHLNCLHVINSDEPEANCFGFSVMQCLATTNAALYGCSVVLWNTAWRKIHRRSVKLFTNRGQASIWPLQGFWNQCCWTWSAVRQDMNCKSHPRVIWRTVTFAFAVLAYSSRKPIWDKAKQKK